MACYLSVWRQAIILNNVGSLFVNGAIANKFS